MQDQQNARASALADFITAILLVVLGLFFFVEAFNMPRLEARRVNPMTIPGLVPMALGLLLVGLSLLLGYRAVKNMDRTSLSGLAAQILSRGAQKAAAAGGLVLMFTLLLIGNMPFWLASMFFIFAFIIVLEVVLSDEPVSLPRSVAWAAGTAVIFGAAIFILFAQIFLVRLP